MSRDFEVGTNVNCEESTVSLSMVLIFTFFCKYVAFLCILILFTVSVIGSKSVTHFDLFLDVSSCFCASLFVLFDSNQF